MAYNTLSPHKVYLFEVTPIKFPILKQFKYNRYGEEMCFIKPGHTHHGDVVKRFDPTVQDGYNKSEKYLDFTFRPLWSLMMDSYQDATRWEDSWTGDNGKYPKTHPSKVWVEKILGCPDLNYYYEATGITELRFVTVREKNKILKELWQYKDDYKNGKIRKYKPRSENYKWKGDEEPYVKDESEREDWEMFTYTPPSSYQY